MLSQANTTRMLPELPRLEQRSGKSVQHLAPSSQLRTSTLESSMRAPMVLHPGRRQMMMCNQTAVMIRQGPGLAHG